jgi:hypothetical protein
VEQEWTVTFAKLADIGKDRREDVEQQATTFQPPLFDLCDSSKSLPGALQYRRTRPLQLLPRHNRADSARMV